MPPRRNARRQQTLDSFLSPNSADGVKAVSASRRRRECQDSTNTSSTSSGSGSGVPPSVPKTNAISRPNVILSDSPSASSDEGSRSRSARMLSEDETSSDSAKISRPRRARNQSSPSSEAGARRAGLPSSSESEGADIVPRKRRRVVKGNVDPLPVGEDLLEELDSDTILDTRFRAPKKSKFSHNLDQLKRAKAKRTLSPSEAASSSALEDSDESLDVIPGSLPPGARVPTPPDESDRDEHDSETFIVEDSDDNVELPLQFSMKSHSDVAHHFKIICQLFVHLATTKPKKRPTLIKKSLKDDYFSVPLSVLRRKLRGINDSIVASSIWKPHFRKRLDTHPRRKQAMLSYSVPLCDACRISGRVATISLRLEGSPYNRDTFEDIELEDAFEGEEETNPDGIYFCLGKFCARRAQTYHSIAHWEFALFMRLEQEVRHLQNPDSSDARDFVRVNWGASEIPDDTHDPDQIMDWLDRRGVITDEYHRIKNVMEEAQTLNAPGHQD